MATVQIDTFVEQFKKLWGAGIEASLNVESKLGEVFISLNCKVGRITPPSSPSFQSSFVRPKYRSPSYFRHQERRKEEREKFNDSTVESSFLKAEEAIVLEDTSTQSAVVTSQQDPDVLNASSTNYDHTDINVIS